MKTTEKYQLIDIGEGKVIKESFTEFSQLEIEKARKETGSHISQGTILVEA